MFEYLYPYLNPNGLIVCDNMFFHDYKKEDAGRQAKKLITKLEAFKLFLNNHTIFESEMIHIGDGLSVSWKKMDSDSKTTKAFIKSIASKYVK
jgi:predicted O-methyltransferase YrrM